MVNWTDPNVKVSRYFTVKEMLWLPSWSRLATEADGLNDEVKANLIKLANVMDQVREYLGKPVRVHVTYRPEEYNRQIGGALRSAHTLGLAMDFDVGEDCNETRQTLLPKLEEFNLRMENINGQWVHLGADWQPGKSRFFKP